MLEMKPEVRKSWCKALRSGEYTQGRGSMRDVVIGEDGLSCDVYCCLGVLTDLYVKAGNPDTYHSGEWDAPLSVFEEGVLVPPVREWAGITDANPALDHHSAVTHNDQLEDSFDTIADLVDDGEGRRV